MDDGEESPTDGVGEGTALGRNDGEPATDAVGERLASGRDEARRELSVSLLSLVAETDTFEEALSEVVELICDATSWGYGEAWVPDGDAVRCVVRYDPDGRHAFASGTADVTLARGEGLAGRVWASGEGEWIADAATAPPDTFVRGDLADAADLHAALAVPITADGTVVAVLTFFTDEPRDRDEKLMETVGALATHVGTLVVRRRLERAVVDERELLDRVLDVSPVGIVVVDRDAGITRVNRAAADGLGVSAETLRDLARRSLLRDPRTPDGEPIPEGEGPVARAFATGEPQLDSQLNVELPSGERADVYVSAAPVVDADGEVRTVVVVLDDRTEEVAFRRDLEAKNRELESFASVLSHDLRNPLGVLKGYLELARETGELAYLDPAERATDRMEALINDLLLLARRGRAVGDRSAVDLADVAEAAWTNVATETATLTLADGLGTVQADESRLQQLFENLFRNAVEHVGPDCHVRVVPVEGGFAVEDDGPGIPEDRREEVLLVGGHDEGGVRLGLAIVAAIAEAHGWSLRIADAAGGGARFEFHTG